MAVTRGETKTKQVKGFKTVADNSTQEKREKLLKALSEYFGEQVQQFQVTAIVDPKPEEPIPKDSFRVVGLQGTNRPLTRGEFASMVAGTIVSWHNTDQLGAAMGMAHALEELGAVPAPSKPHPR
jgi:hypothetical protein